MIELLALALAYAGFLLLAMAMHRHHRQIWHGAVSQGARAGLRIAGAGGLAASFAACVAGSGWSIGPVLWLGLLSLAALGVVLLLAYRPRTSALIAPVIVFLAGAAGLRGLAGL